MKLLRTWWPALAGIVALLVLYILVRGRGDETTAPPPPPIAAPAAPSPSIAMHGSAAPTAAPTALTDTDVDDEGVPLAKANQEDPRPVPGPEPKAKKPKMTLDEKLAEAGKHIPVLAKRADILEAEVAQLEAAGKTKEAAEQRVVIKRIRAHMDELRAAIAEHREPM